MATLLAATVVTVPAASAAPAAPTRCPDPSLKKDIKKADVVFRGIVTKASPVRGKADQRRRNYRVQADRVYKSSLVTDHVIVTAAVGARCAVPRLAEDKRYLFFVTESGSRLLATTATARAGHTLTQKVVARLGNGAVPKPSPPATAQFTRVADARPAALSRLLAPGAALVILSLLGLLVLGRVTRRA